MFAVILEKELMVIKSLNPQIRQHKSSEELAFLIICQILPSKTVGNTYINHSVYRHYN